MLVVGLTGSSRSSRYHAVMALSTHQILAPDMLSGPAIIPLVTAVKSSGAVVYLKYPVVRLAILFASIVLGVLMWLALNRTRVGMLVRAGVDDREMLSATGVRIQRVFMMVFGFGAGLAGIEIGRAHV